MTCLSELRAVGIDVSLSVDGNIKLSAPPGTITGDLLEQVKTNKDAIISELVPDLQNWICRARSAPTIVDVQNVLDQFRPLKWTDEQRAEMARACERHRQAIAKLNTS